MKDFTRSLAAILFFVMILMLKQKSPWVASASVLGLSDGAADFDLDESHVEPSDVCELRFVHLTQEQCFPIDEKPSDVDVLPKARELYTSDQLWRYETLEKDISRKGLSDHFLQTVFQRTGNDVALLFDFFFSHQEALEALLGQPAQSHFVHKAIRNIGHKLKPEINRRLKIGFDEKNSKAVITLLEFCGVLPGKFFNFDSKNLPKKYNLVEQDWDILSDDIVLSERALRGFVQQIEHGNLCARAWFIEYLSVMPLDLYYSYIDIFNNSSFCFWEHHDVWVPEGLHSILPRRALRSAINEGDFDRINDMFSSDNARYMTSSVVKYAIYAALDAKNDQLLSVFVAHRFYNRFSVFDETFVNYFLGRKTYSGPLMERLFSEYPDEMIDVILTYEWGLSGDQRPLSSDLDIVRLYGEDIYEKLDKTMDALLAPGFDLHSSWLSRDASFMRSLSEKSGYVNYLFNYCLRREKNLALSRYDISFKVFVKNFSNELRDFFFDKLEVAMVSGSMEEVSTLFSSFVRIGSFLKDLGYWGKVDLSWERIDLEEKSLSNHVLKGMLMLLNSWHERFLSKKETHFKKVLGDVFLTRELNPASTSRPVSSDPYLLRVLNLKVEDLVSRQLELAVQQPRLLTSKLYTKKLLSYPSFSLTHPLLNLYKTAGLADGLKRILGLLDVWSRELAPQIRFLHFFVNSILAGKDSVIDGRSGHMKRLEEASHFNTYFPLVHMETIDHLYEKNVLTDSLGYLFDYLKLKQAESCLASSVFHKMLFDRAFGDRNHEVIKKILDSQWPKYLQVFGVMEVLVEEENQAMLTLFFEKRPPLCRSDLLSAPFEKKQYDMVKFLLKYIALNQDDKGDLSRAKGMLLRSCVVRTDVESAKWLLSTFNFLDRHMKNAVSLAISEDSSEDLIWLFMLECSRRNIPIEQYFRALWSQIFTSFYNNLSDGRFMDAAEIGRLGFSLNYGRLLRAIAIVVVAFLGFHACFKRLMNKYHLLGIGRDLENFRHHLMRHLEGLRSLWRQGELNQIIQAFPTISEKFQEVLSSLSIDSEHFGMLDPFSRELLFPFVVVLQDGQNINFTEPAVDYFVIQKKPGVISRKPLPFFRYVFNINFIHGVRELVADKIEDNAELKDDEKQLLLKELKMLMQSVPSLKRGLEWFQDSKTEKMMEVGERKQSKKQPMIDFFTGLSCQSFNYKKEDGRLLRNIPLQDLLSIFNPSLVDKKDEMTVSLNMIP